MQLWDTYHAFVFSHDAIPEIFVNSMYWFKKIRHDQKYIASKLEEYRPLIQHLFDATHISTSADKLIDKTKTVLDFTVKSTEKIQQITNFVGKKIVKGCKQSVVLLKSKLLCKELEMPLAHTPFVLNKSPDIDWTKITFPKK